MKVKPNPDGSWTIVNSKGKPMLGLDGQPVRYLTEAEAQETLKLLPPEDSAVSPRQQAMDMIKKMAEFYGWDIVERAENILAKRLEGASDDMILKTFIPQLLSGLGDELLAEAGEQQWRLDVGAAIKTFKDEYDHVFKQPLRLRRSLSTSVRETALIDITLDLLERDFMRYLDLYDDYLTVQAAEGLTPDMIRVGPLDYFRGAAPSLMKALFPALDARDTQGLQDEITQSYLQRAEVVQIESDNRKAFRARLKVFQDTLDAQRNDLDLDPADRDRLSKAFEDVAKGADDAETQWIASGALDMETAVNAYFTQQLQIATTGTPLYSLLVPGLAIDSLDAIGQVAGAKATAEAEAKAEAKATATKVQATGDILVAQWKEWRTAIQARLPSATPEMIERIITAALDEGRDPMEALLNQQTADAALVKVQEAERVRFERDTQRAQIINTQYQASLKGQGVSGLATGLGLPHALIPGGTTTLDIVAGSPRLVADFGSIEAARAALLKAGLVETDGVVQVDQVGLAITAAQAAADEQRRAKELERVTSEVETGLTPEEAKEERDLAAFRADPTVFGATEAPTAAETAAMEQRRVALEAKRLSHVRRPVPSPPLGPPSREARGRPPIRVGPPP